MTIGLRVIPLICMVKELRILIRDQTFLSGMQISVSEAIGGVVTPGTNRAITWNAGQD
jgi:hypothetical protein